MTFEYEKLINLGEARLKSHDFFHDSFPMGKRLRGKAKLSEAATALWSHEVGYVDV